MATQATAEPAVSSGPATDYLDLVKRFPLAHIRDDDHLAAAHAVIDTLSILGEDDLTDGQMEYLLALGDLTMIYEQEDMDELLKDVTPLDRLTHFVTEFELTADDVGRILREPDAGTAVLDGSRPITPDHAVLLANHFGVRAALFLG